MSVLDALRRGVRHYPGSLPSLLVRADPTKTPEVARKELAGNTTHKLGADLAATMAAMCCEVGSPHCYDYASAIAEECGGTFTPGIARELVKVDPFTRVADLMRETSDVAGTVIAAMADGVVTDNELALIEREIAEAECVLRRLRQAARAVNVRAKPADVRTQTHEQWLREYEGAPAHA